MRPLCITAAILSIACSAQQPQQIVIDTNAPTTPFPHFWEQAFGSGRAILALRQNYRDDLTAVKQATDFHYIRFHAIFHDEVGVYKEDDHGNPVFNFAYVDQIYDSLLERGVRPIVEIGFMPRALAYNPDGLHAFWYRPNVSPPKSYEKWDALITAFSRHLVARYGIDEVAQWYFEVWNEPNIDFWNGVPREGSYFELYAHTARALKAVDTRLRVGGPATAAAAWIPSFLRFTAAQHVPVDFVSTHGYADDSVDDLFGTNETISMDHRACLAIAKVRREIRSSPTPSLPLLWTEWNVPGKNEVRDTSYVGPAVANTIRECDGTVDMLSFWTFSDVFEENGPIPKPFEGHFGLRAAGGINKPSFYAFSLLHHLGDRRLAHSSPNVIVTRRQDGSLAIAAWNLGDIEKDGRGSPIDLRFVFEHAPAGATVMLSLVDDDHGNTLSAYRAMGSPESPTREQVRKLNAATALPPPVSSRLDGNRFDLKLQVNALALIEIPAIH